MPVTAVMLKASASHCTECIFALIVKRWIEQRSVREGKKGSTRGQRCQKECALGLSNDILKQAVVYWEEWLSMFTLFNEGRTEEGRSL